jgi:hypothetical protein
VSDDGDAPAGAEQTRSVRIIGLPVPLWAKAQEEVDDLFREFALIALGDRPGDRELPQRLGAILQELSQRYGHIGGTQEARLQQASEEGLAEIDLVYEVPTDIRGAVRGLGDLLEEADEYCRRGRHLLTLASSEDARAFRCWFLEEFERQVDGEAPTSWRDSRWALELAEQDD